MTEEAEIALAVKRTSHVCTACFRDMTEHDELCSCGCGRFFPALCCPGCACHSYEDAHQHAEEGVK